MKQLSLSVAPEFIPAFARDLLLEDNWRKALLVLKSVTTPSISMENAIEVLKGNLTFAFNASGTLELAPQPQDCPKLQRMQSTENWQQAGLYERDGFYYQPYASIEGFGKDDETRVLQQLENWEDSVPPDSFREMRAKCYMQDSLHDLVFFDIHPTPILFKRVPDPAFWRQVWVSPEEAFKDYQKHRKNEMRLLGSSDDAISSKSWQFYFEAIRQDRVYVLSEDEDVPGLDKESHTVISSLVRIKTIFDTDLQTASEGRAEMLKHNFDVCCAALKMHYAIIKQAKKMGGFLTLSLKYPVTLISGERVTQLSVPTGPFLLWCQARRNDNRAQGEIPEWKPICSSGMKMLGDSATHSDWWIGAGLVPQHAYDMDHPANKAAWAFALDRAKTAGRNCIKLAGKGRVTGLVVKPLPNTAVPAGCIAVVPSAGVDYELALLSACKHGTGAVISEVGGKLAHLATVSRELGARLVVMENALSTLVEGEIVTVNIDEGHVSAYRGPNWKDDL